MKAPAKPESPPSPSPAPTSRPRLPLLLTLAAWLLLTGVLTATLIAGYAGRRAMWQSTTPVRYVPDMQNAWNWGSRAANEGYVTLYERVISENPRGNYGLDYVPLRLLCMSLWASHHQSQGNNEYQNTWEFNNELMYFNLACDLAASVAAGGLVFGVLRRAGRSRLHAAWAGVTSGAALYLSPAVWVSGFGRPTWDVWVLPFFLAACWAAWGRWWALSGALLAAGAMFKGQQLAVVPFFLIWALVSGGLRARSLEGLHRDAGQGLIWTVRWLAGFALSAGLIVSPWILTRPDAPVSPAGFPNARVPDLLSIAAVLTATLLPWLLLLLWAALVRRRQTRDLSAPMTDSPSNLPPAPRWRVLFPRRLAGWALTLSLVLATGVLWSMSLRPGATLAWFEVAFRYGADKFPDLEVGRSSSLAGILKTSYRWKSDSLIVALPEGWPELTMKRLLVGVYGLCVLITAIAAGLHHRRGRPALLITIPAVWICYFAFMPLMHERYLLWGAASAALVLWVSPGLSLIGAFLSLLSWAMTLYVMLWAGNRPAYLLLGYDGNKWAEWIRVTYPGAGWAVMLAALIFLYAACFHRSATSERQSAKPLPLDPSPPNP